MGTEDDVVFARCLGHAEALLRAATALAAQGQHNIAFHLGLIAIEEVGKAHLLLLGSLSAPQPWRDPVDEDKLEDHGTKIFWALWLTFGAFPGSLLDDSKSGKEIAASLRSEITSTQDLAGALHEHRLRALYVDPSPSARAPDEVVDEKLSKWLLDSANACVTRAKATKPRQLEAQRKLPPLVDSRC